jgi:hypothetical protein
MNCILQPAEMILDLRETSDGGNGEGRDEAMKHLGTLCETRWRGSGPAY